MCAKMAIDSTFVLIISSLILFLYLMLYKKPKPTNLPPGPPKLPMIGNIHLLTGTLPHRAFRDLAQKYGPIMHMQLGQISTIIVSSPRLAKEVLKTNDLALANRPYALVADIIMYGRADIVFGCYGDYWRQMKKIITVELLSPKKVRSLCSLREEAVNDFMGFIQSSCGNPFLLRKEVIKVNNNIMCKCSFGNNCKQQDVFIKLVEQALRLASGFYVTDLFPGFGFFSVISGMKSKLTKIHKSLDKILDGIIEERRIKRKTFGALEDDLLDVLLNIKERGGLSFPIIDNNIKAIFLDIIVGGTDSAAITIEWAMTELMRNPDVMKKAQTKVREVFKGKETIVETEFQELVYIKNIIKETLRLHPPGPLLMPRECRESCQINGYDIPVKTKVIINAFACSTDPEYWSDPESFKPERFENSLVDPFGKNYEFIPFGAGRRICPGITFGLASVELILAKMLYHFDWKLPYRLYPNDIDITELPSSGITVTKKLPLEVIPTLYSSK